MGSNENGTLVLRTLGDGHCLLHAVILSWHHQIIKKLPPSLHELKCAIFVESVIHRSYYTDFLPDLSSKEQYMKLVADYVLRKNYNTSYGDIVPVVLSNALAVGLIIEDMQNGISNIVRITPTANPSHFLNIHRSNDHYCGSVGYQSHHRQQPQPGVSQSHPKTIRYTSEEILRLKPSSTRVPRLLRKVIFTCGIWKPRTLPNPTSINTKSLMKSKVAATDMGCSKGSGQAKIPVRVTARSVIHSSTIPTAPTTRCLTPVNLHKLHTHRPHHCRGRTLLSVLNARSCCNKDAVIRDCITDNNIDLLALTETWMSNNTEARVSAGLTPDGYNILYRNRGKGKGGGVALIYRSSFKCTRSKCQPHYKSFECLEVTVSGSSAAIKLAIVYRPPPSAANGLSNTDFHSDFADYITTLHSSSSKIVMVGDFNIHWENINDSESSQFHQLLSSTNFSQHVSSPTHIGGHMLDWIVSRPTDNIVDTVNVGDLISDHNIVHCNLHLCRPSLPMKNITFRRLKVIDHDAIKRDLMHSKIVALKDTAPSPATYNRCLSDLLDLHAPEKTRTITLRPSCLWMSEAILTEKRKRRKFESKWRQTGLSVHRDNYVNQRDLVNRLIQRAKVEHFTDKVSECGNDQKALFNIVKSLLNKPTDAALTRSDVCADDFNCHFLDKIKEIHKNLDIRSWGGSPHEFPSTCDSSIDQFIPISQQDLIKTIRRSPSKTSKLDPWPTWMVKLHLDTLSPLLTQIVNHSLLSAIFPSEWKHALVTPILKKPSLDPLTLKNYRPVSNLPFISKVVERVVSSQLASYLHKNGLNPIFQSAYRPDHSVETALLRVHNDILEAMDKQQGVILVLLDLSSAFDTICHDTLLRRIHDSFGVDGNILKWLRSYLGGRSQSVVFGGDTSSPLAVPQGVPQGSVLGPMLFSIYTSPISNIVHNHNMNFHLYADDTQIYFKFNFKTEPSLESAIDYVEKCVHDIDNWMGTNKLKLNGDKTEWMILTSPRLRPHVELSTITIDNSIITASPVIRNLGSWFDQAATMTEHVNAICKSCYYHLHNIAAIRDILTRESAVKLIHAFVSSRLDNCNSLLIGIPLNLLHKLQRVQNTAARIVTRQNKHDSIREILKQLHWLPVRQRIMYKALCLTFKCVHGSAPAYLSDLVQIYIPSRGLRSTGQMLLLQRRSTTKLYGDRQFAVAAPKWWNELPAELRHCATYESFKKLLKTHLFRLAYR